MKNKSQYKKAFHCDDEVWPVSLKIKSILKTGEGNILLWKYFKSSQLSLSTMILCEANGKKKTRNSSKHDYKIIVKSTLPPQKINAINGFSSKVIKLAQLL